MAKKHKVSFKKEFDAVCLHRFGEQSCCLIYENAAEGIVLMDREGKILDANKAWLNMVGYSINEVSGKDYKSFISEEEVHIQDELMEVMLKNKSTGHFESKYVNKSGETVPVSVNMSTKRDTGGKLLGYIAIVRDNTDKNKLEKSLLRSANLAAIGTLARGVAHEFNNILSVIMTWTALSKLDRSEENFEKAVDAIEKNCLRGANLISSLLDFSRIRKASKVFIDVNSLLEETLTLLKEPLKASKIKISKSYSEVPKLNADKRQIQQVFFHILNNSKDALQDMQGEIDIETSFSENTIKIKFSDNGMGIPEKNMEKIFLPFFTTKGALGKSEIPGTGLGLYVAHNIVENYDGRIEVESQVGKGTSVSIYFPVSEERSEEKGNLAKKINQGEKKKAKVLLLEDEKFILRGLKSFISLLGHQVFTARDADVALKILKHETFDIAFLDIVMEGEKDGLDVYKKIKERGDRTKIVLITARSIDDELMEGERKGLYKIVGKPFELEEINHLIENMLDSLSQ